MSRFRSGRRDRSSRTLPVTNGLLNPHRRHYDEYYGAIPPEAAIFEGIMGSEFLKGEFAIGGTISRARREVLTTDESPDRIIRRGYGGFSEPFIGGMIEYIGDVHGARLMNVNTREGFEPTVPGPSISSPGGYSRSSFSSRRGITASINRSYRP